MSARYILKCEGIHERGADTIAFASCITKGTPIGFACPNAQQKQLLKNWVIV